MEKLIALLNKYKTLFDGNLGTWDIDLVEFEPTEVSKPVCLILYPAPKLHESMFKKRSNI